MWKQRLFTSTKVRTVNKRFCGQSLGRSECLFFIIYGTLVRRVDDYTQVPDLDQYEEAPTPVLTFTVITLKQHSNPIELFLQLQVDQRLDHLLVCKLRGVE